jgi:putative peptidoglycan lipid II flippase
MWSRFLPGIFGVGGFAVIGLLNLYFSGLLEEGTHTYIYYGDRLLELPRSLIAISMGTALLPHLSHFAVRGQTEQMLKSAADQRDILLFLTLPCVLAFYFLGLPIVEVLFKRGRFDAVTAENTALVLKIYSVLLISSSLSRVLATCFYAVKNTWYPAVSSCLYVLFHWIFTPYMMQFFDLEGLIWATVISNVFFMCLLTGAYPFFVGQLYLMRTFKKMVFSLPLLVALALYLYFSFGFLTGLTNQLFSVFALLFVVVSSIILYFVLGSWLRLPQAVECMSLMKKKMRGKDSESGDY